MLNWKSLNVNFSIECHATTYGEVTLHRYVVTVMFSDPGFEPGQSDNGGQQMSTALIVLIWMVIAILLFLFR